MKANLTALVLLLTAAVAQADTKQVTATNRLVRLEVSAGDGVDVSWEAREPLDLYFLTERTAGGKACVFFYVAGERVVIVSDVIDWDGRKRTKDTWIVTTEGPAPPPPGPQPPTPQPDRYGLSAVAKAALAKVTDRSLQAALAANFSSTASAVAAGGLRSVDDARKAIQVANRATLGSSEGLWRPWLLDVGRAVDALEDGGQIATVKDYGVALAEIAKGLQ